jgi:NAD+ synthase (glutamine-hydrolysing)
LRIENAMPANGLLRCAAAAPPVAVANPEANARHAADALRRFDDRGVHLAVFPECSLTGYTCADLFHQDALLNAAERALLSLLEIPFAGVAVVGLPVRVAGGVFNAAAVMANNTLLGVVPKSYLPNYKEFYDARYFTPGRSARATEITLAGRTVPFGTDLLFAASNEPDFVLGVEICEDLWMPVPPSSLQALAGATVVANLSASNETIGKAQYRRSLVAGQSARCMAGYLYASSGPTESTTDLVFGGHCLIAENGNILQESERFRRAGSEAVADLDLERLRRDRTLTNSFHDGATSVFRTLRFNLTQRPAATPILRHTDPHPFVPSDPATLGERCAEIFHTQVCALAKRLDVVGNAPLSLGVSGGLDSTLAVLVAVKTLDELQQPRSRIQGLTMPGFGTTRRTKGNAWNLLRLLGLTGREIDIRELCLAEMRALSHRPFGLNIDHDTMDSLTDKLRALPPERRSDLTFENLQARVRTSLLMNSGFVLGTGDLSELALGWCTYNADHMSMYNVNTGVPKTLVKFLVRWAALNEFDGDVRATLLDVAATEISPELLPTNADGSAGQATEDTVGPYELHDFFIYHLLRWGASPRKILFLASQTKFDVPYTPEVIRKTLQGFLRRFFTNQFKRSCVPDGPKVGSVSLSPRGDWRMPSDASAAAWLAEVE